MKYMFMQTMIMMQRLSLFRQELFDAEMPNIDADVKERSTVSRQYQRNSSSRS
jgi:hypothetical protein